MKQLLQCINNSNSCKEISRLKNETNNRKKKQEIATLQMKAEVNAKQSNTQTNRH